jgi:hypothetical protein
MYMLKGSRCSGDFSQAIACKWVRVPYKRKKKLKVKLPVC